jgi:hypothetical protein
VSSSSNTFLPFSCPLHQRRKHRPGAGGRAYPQF